MQLRRNIVSLAAIGLMLQLFNPIAGRGQQPGPRSGRVWAIVIGIARYAKLPGGLQLQFADQDARAFASAIKAAGVPAQNVKTLIGNEATVDAIRTAIGSWLPRSASPDDIVYIFFSGHGYVERDFNDSYLLAYDSDPQNIYSTAISAADMEYIFDHRLKAKRVLFLQDAERRDFFGNDATGREDSSTFASSFSHLASSRPGIAVITASSPGEFSWEGKRWGDQGAFTKYLVEGLSGKADKDGDGTVSDSELFAYLADRLPKDTSNKQHPWRAGASQLLIAMTGSGSGFAASSSGPSNTTASSTTASSTTASSTTAGASGSIESSTSAANRPSPPEPVTTIITTGPASKPRPTPGAGRTVSDEHAPTNVGPAEQPNPNRPDAAHPVEKTPVAPPGPPSVAPVSGVQPSRAEASSTGAVTSTASGPAPSPLIHEMEAALASGRLVEPAGYSAWDIYQKLNRMEPYPAQMADLRSGLVEALLKQSTQILSADATLDMVSVHMDDFKLAGRMLGALREIDSSQPDLPLLQKLAAVDALIALQFYDEAEQSLGSLKDSPSASVQNSFGLMYKGQYDDWRAERSFKRSTELDPKWATPHYNLGLIYEAQNKPEALAEFEQAGTLDPSNARFQEALGDEYFHGQQWAKAADAYRKAIASNPGFDALHTKLGHALYSEGLRDEADKEYKRALELSGKH